MKWSWKFGQEIMPLLVTRRALKEILIEYDGPRLAILEQPPDQILAGFRNSSYLKAAVYEDDLAGDCAAAVGTE